MLKLYITQIYYLCFTRYIERIIHLMENTDNCVAFKATYSNDFKDKTRVETLISAWHNNASHFTLTTSGSTGLPKQIELEKKVLIWSAEATKMSLDLDSERIFCCLPVQKTGGFMQLIRALYFDWDIHFINASSHPFKDVNLVNYSLTSLTPSQLLNVLKIGNQLSQFRNVLIGGAPIPKETSELLMQWNKKNPQTTFWETYGMTETASHVALKNLSRGETHFKPQKGVELIENEGKLNVRIPDLDLSLQTNDLVKLDANRFEVIGRSNNVINTGGIKLHPEIIEPQIAEILKIMGFERRFYVTSKKDKKLGEKAILVMEGVPIADTHFILETLKRELPTYNNPKEIIYENVLAFTNTGKLVRKKF